MESESLINQVSNSLENSLLQQNENANIGKSERLLSIGTGAFIGLKGITNIFSNPLTALVELGIGGALLYRGVTGYCAVTAMVEENMNTGTTITNRAMDDTVPVTNTDRVEPRVAY